MEAAINGKGIFYSDHFKKGYDFVLACNDVLEFLEGVPENTATLVVTSPPYNIGKPYEERVEFKKYIDWQKQVIEKCVGILRPEGSLCWEVGNYVEEKEVFPLDLFFYHICKNLGLKLRNRIIWHFEHGLHASQRFSGRYETILWFTRSDHYIFNLDAVRVPQKYRGKHAYKGPNRGMPTSNPLGKNPSDIWSIVLQDWENQIWDIPNVKSNHPEKTIHGSQFPIELVERLVLALTNKSDVVFDPFVGVGSSLIASALHERKGIGVDREKVYTDLAYDRIVKALEGTLRRRPLGMPVWKPKGNEKVVRPPEEWQTKSFGEFVK
jgi:adenine-specific DNA-methyltransferase